MPHHRSRRTVQSCLPGDKGSSVPAGEYDWSCTSLGPASQQNRSVQLFLGDRL